MNPSSRPLQDSEFETKNQARDDEIDHIAKPDGAHVREGQYYLPKG
jgi:hypothetical protein